MTFKIEFSDQRFRVVAPNGDYEDAVSYCAVSTVEHEGTVYGAYLAGDEDELETLTAHPIDTTMVTTEIKVYDLSDWPNLVPVVTEIEECEFDEDEPEPAADVTEPVV
jgi:hypothetical protein